jgi:hypothetical protein
MNNLNFQDLKDIIRNLQCMNLDSMVTKEELATALEEVLYIVSSLNSQIIDLTRFPIHDRRY